MPKTRKRNGFATTNKEQQQGEGETKNKGEKQTKKKTVVYTTLTPMRV